MWKILVGEDVKSSEEKSGKIGALTEYLIESYSEFSPLLASLPSSSMARWPFIRKFTGFDTADLVSKVASKYLVQHWDQKKTSKCSDQSPKSLLDVIWNENKETIDESSPFFGVKGNIFSINILVLFN